VLSAAHCLKYRAGNHLARWRHRAQCCTLSEVSNGRPNSKIQTLIWDRWQLTWSDELEQFLKLSAGTMSMYVDVWGFPSILHKKIIIRSICYDNLFEVQPRRSTEQIMINQTTGHIVIVSVYRLWEEPLFQYSEQMNIQTACVSDLKKSAVPVAIRLW